MFELEGSGKYLCDEKSSEKTFKCSFIYQATTFDEQFNPYYDALKELSVPFECLDCTHVVIGIKWGANAILSVDYQDDSDESTKKIEGKFKATSEKIKVALSGEAGLEFSDEEKEIKKGLSVKFVGDVLLGNDVATSIDGVSGMIKSVKDKMAQTNEGKGLPIEYKLYPLKKLEGFYASDHLKELIIVEIEQTILNQVLQHFDEISTIKQKLNDFIALLI